MANRRRARARRGDEDVPEDVAAAFAAESDLWAGECAALRTRMAARTLTRAYDKAMRETGLKLPQFSLLVSIRANRPTSIAELAEQLAMERTTLIRNLQLLEKRGLVEFLDGGAGRARRMRLTRLGERKLKEAIPCWRAAQSEVVGRLGPERWRETRDVLRKLAELF